MSQRWPTVFFPPLPTIHIFSTESIGLDQASTPASGGASTAWPAANDALFVPFHLEAPITVTKLACKNGTAVSGNIDMGIYNADGTRRVSIGSTVQAGTTTLQVFDVTDTPLGPGDYYWALALDNGTGTIYRFTVGSTVNLRRMGLRKMASAFPLPAVATFAALTANYVPYVGLLQGRTVW